MLAYGSTSTVRPSGDINITRVVFMHDYRARQALGLLLVPPKAGDKHGSPTPAIKFFDQQEIYPGAYVQ